MKTYDIAAYIWPAYHHEPKLDFIWQDGIGEWQTVKRARPRFEGHNQPRIPLLGYQDEADPAVMKQQVELALNYGVNVFIMDWYWYENEPFLEGQLNKGLLPAIAGTDMRFYLMWANHDANSTWDASTDEYNVYWSGVVDRTTFYALADRIIEKYLCLPNYYCINNKPVFCIYYLENLVRGLGGVEQTKDALNSFQQKAITAGLDGIHFQTIKRGVCMEIMKTNPDSEKEFIQGLPIDSVTQYQFVHEARPPMDYRTWTEIATAKWEEYKQIYGCYFPQVSIGWDPTPRYPTTLDIIANETPADFEACLQRAKVFIDAHPDQPPLLTINSWNEWTEGSYLLPDQHFGYAYLEAVRNVFGGMDR